MTQQSATDEDALPPTDAAREFVGKFVLREPPAHHPSYDLWINVVCTFAKAMEQARLTGAAEGREWAAAIADKHAEQSATTAKRGRKIAKSPIMAFHDNPELYEIGAECCEAAASEAVSIAAAIRKGPGT